MDNHAVNSRLWPGAEFDLRTTKELRKHVVLAQTKTFLCEGKFNSQS